MKTGSRLCQNLFFGIIVTTCFFSVIEFGLRLSPWKEMLGPARFYGGLEDHSMFWDRADIIKIPNDEFRVADEFRGKRVLEQKPGDTYRILCLRGSFTYGWPYRQDASIAYPARLEQLLNNQDEGTQRFEVINAGIGGYTSYQGLFYFKNRLYRLDPDLVIICFGANDGNNNYEIGVFCSDKEYYERLLSLSNNRAFFRMKQGLENLSTYALMEKIVFNIKKIFIKPMKRVPPKDFRENLEEFIRLAKEHDFKIFFVLEPHINLYDFQQELRDNIYYNIMHALAIENPEFVKLIDTVSLLRQYQDKDIFYDEMHLLPFGHKVLAELIFEVYKRTGAL